jgi:DNA end-binding protein Ku
VGLESTRTIDIEQFVASDDIEWIWYDTPYYLMPADDVAHEAFAVIRNAMESTDTVGISRLVLARRERAVLLQPCGKGILLWTLRYGDEVRPARGGVRRHRGGKRIRSSSDADPEGDRGTVAAWDPSMVCDPVQQNLEKLIASKQKKRGGTRKAKPAEAPEEPSNVVNIMDALRKSIAKEKSKKPGG